MSGEPEGPPAKGRTPMSYVGLGMELALPLVLFLFGGRWLDRRLDTEPWLMLVGALLGIAVGFWSLFRGLLPPKDGRGGKRE